jgi:hypothetical protein
MFPWMREQMSCTEAVRVFVRENAPFLELLERELYGLPLQFRCDAENAVSNGHFNMAVPEIVLSEAPRGLGAQRTREDLLVTLHHELIHASDCILEDFDTNGVFSPFSRPHSHAQPPDTDALACTEIRAHHWANCAGGLFFVKACTRSGAVSSVRHHMSETQAVMAVERNFARCFALGDPTRLSRKD